METYVSNEPRAYRFPLLTRIIALLGTIFFFVFAYWSASDNELVIASCFALVALLSLIGFISCLYKVNIDDKFISTTSFFQTKSMEWHEIVDIEFKESGFTLLNNSGDKKVKISSQVVDFLEVVDLVTKKISPIWNSKTLNEFHISPSLLVLFIGMGLFGVLTIFAGVYEFMVKSSGLLSSLGGLLIGMLFLAVSVSIPIKETFDSDCLIIAWVRGEKRIHVSEIESFLVVSQMVEHAYQYPVHVKLKNGKTLRFNSLREGTFIFECLFSVGTRNISLCQEQNQLNFLQLHSNVG